MRQEDGLWLAINGGVLADKIYYAIETHGQFWSLLAFGTTGQMNVVISNLMPVEQPAWEGARFSWTIDPLDSVTVQEPVASSL